MSTDQKLQDAKNALHELQLGKKIVTLSKGGRTVSFNQVQLLDLKSYIAELETELGAKKHRRFAAGVSL